MLNRLKLAVHAINHALAGINSTILLTMIFLLVIIPFGIIMRLVRALPVMSRTQGSSWMAARTNTDPRKPF